MQCMSIGVVFRVCGDGSPPTFLEVHIWECVCLEGVYGVCDVLVWSTLMRVCENAWVFEVDME